MKLLMSSLVIAVLVLIGQKVGIEQGLYVEYPFFDIPMHILGGVGIGLFILGLERSGAFRSRSIKRKILAGVFVAGLVWEVFEIVYNLNGYPFGTKAYLLDTLKDLADDMIGGALVAWAAKYH